MLPGTVGIVPACCYDKEDKNLDDFREWLSDNLRYFMLGGAILLIVVVLFSVSVHLWEAGRAIPARIQPMSR